MSVRHALLALLTERPQHGYHLKMEFERRTGGTWPLNIGQVYTTLQRLERDDLVAAQEPGEAGSVLYEATRHGSEEVARWWRSPVDRSSPARDELAIKLALAVTVPGVDVQSLVQRQRTATMTWLQQLTRLSTRPDETHDLAWSLVLQRLLFETEAEARWLDHVEAAVLRATAQRATAQHGTREPGTQGLGTPGGSPASSARARASTGVSR